MKQLRGVPGVVLAVLLCGVCAPGALARSLGYGQRSVLGVPVHVITVNLADPRVRVSVVTARRFPGSVEPIDRLLARSMPSAAVTGTYFSKRTRLPVGDIVVDGIPRYFGGLGTAMAITPFNTVEFRSVPYGRHQDWSAFETVLAAGPRLLTGGRVSVNPRAEGFSDPHVLGRARRTAVGLTGEGKLLLVASERALTLTELARILSRLGAVEAMALDGGNSTAMYFDGRHRVRPQRSLVNLLVVHEDVPLLTRAVTPMSPEAQAAHRPWRAAKAAEHYAAGERLRPRGQAGPAMAHFSAAMTLAPDNASYCVALARTLEAGGHAAAAAEALARAGGLLVAKGEYGRAIAELTRALSLDGLNDEARSQLALAHRHLSRSQQSEASAPASYEQAPTRREYPPHILGRQPPTAISAGPRRRLGVLRLPWITQPRWLGHAHLGMATPGGTDLIVRDALGNGVYVLADANLLAVISLIADSLDYVHASADQRPLPLWRALQPTAGGPS